MHMAVSRKESHVTQTLLRVSAPAVIAVAAIAVAIWWWSSQHTPHVTPTTAAASVTPGVVPDAPDPIELMLERARAALTERRLLAPSGDNAVAIYLAVLDREPDHAIARQALLELIPLAGEAVEVAIASGDLAEARRRLDLFQRMGVSELRLDTLRQELAVATTEAERQQAPEATEQAAPAAAGLVAAAVTAQDTATPPVSPPALPKPGATSPQSLARSGPAVPATTSGPANEPPATSPAATKPMVSGASTGSTQPAAGTSTLVVEPRQIVDARAAYPPQARQRRIEGWVELEFAVSAQGKVGDIRVINSEPARVFDREAQRAAARWRFEPRRENGVAVATRVRKTLSFKLASG